MPRKQKGQTGRYYQNLNGRIEFATDQGLLASGANLHHVLTRWNGLAHNSHTTVTWAELRTDIAAVHAELKHLNCVGDRPDYQFYAERNIEDSAGADVSVVWHYQYGVKAGNKWRMRMEYTKKLESD